MYVFTQLVDFKNDTLSMARTPFPCMITALCKDKGVKGTTYNKLEDLESGPMTDTFDEKGVLRTYAAKAKPVGTENYLTTLPPKKAKPPTWSKLLYC